MDIFVRYCGGCNCQIDRVRIIKAIENSLGAGCRLTTDASHAPFGAGILMCGCPSACVNKPEITDLARNWIVIAGKTLDFREMPETELAGAVGARISEMATHDRGCLRETKALSHKGLNEDLDGALRIQEGLFRTYIGSEDNHQRIDALQAKLAARKK